MLSWLDRFFRGVAGQIGQGISDAIHWAVHALAAVVFGVFRNVGKAWADFKEAVSGLGRGLEDFAKSAWNAMAYILHHVIPSLIKWAEAKLALLAHDLARLYDDTVKWVREIYDWIAHQVASLAAWVIRDIWNPLKAYADQIWNDLLRWGYTAWWWITHLADLAEALIFHIAASMEKHAFELAKMLGTFTLALIMANVKKVAMLLEDIVTAVF